MEKIFPAIRHLKMIQRDSGGTCSGAITDEPAFP